MVQMVLILTMVKMIHEEHKRTFIVDRIMEILEKRHDIHLPDAGRYVSAFDYVRTTRKWVHNIVEKEKKLYLKVVNKKVQKIQDGIHEVKHTKKQVQ